MRSSISTSTREKQDCISKQIADFLQSGGSINTSNTPPPKPTVKELKPTKQKPEKK